MSQPLLTNLIRLQKLVDKLKNYTKKINYISPEGVNKVVVTYEGDTLIVESLISKNKTTIQATYSSDSNEYFTDDNFDDISAKTKSVTYDVGSNTILKSIAYAIETL